MTQEEKSRAYDEAIEKFDVILNLNTVKESGTIFADDVRKIFPELKESEDEKIRKNLINYFRCIAKNGDTVWTNLDYDKVIAWLEKQRYSEYELENEYWRGYDDGKKQGEQKPADKVEPKFHEGDWVVSPNGVYWHIDKISNNRYEVTTNTGKGSGCWNLDTNIYHKFTIQDAKDGDVLSYRDGQWIFIYKEKIDDSSFYYHTLYSTIHQDLTINDSGSTSLSDAIIPATKEQRDTLMKVMADAGYTFDFEKKELRKIGHKLAWSKEDDYYHGIIQYILNNECVGKTDKENAIKWFNSLKDRVQPKPKQEWSEEDEKVIHCLEYTVRHFYEDEDTVRWCCDWLKSLRPQNRWKPSDEQMKLLKELVEDNNQRYFYTLLRSLYVQLKILKGK